MDFRFTDDQLTLAESVRDYLAGTHGPEVLRRLDAEGNRDPAIWQGLVDMGLTALLVPEEHGGLGLGLVEAALIATECGRACLAEPLVDTAFVAVPWLVRQGKTAELGAIAAGTRKVALPHVLNPWVADGADEFPGQTLQSVDPLRNLVMFPASGSADPHLLDLGALMSAAQLVGLAEAMLHQATEYAKVRTQFGQPVGAFQGLKHQLAQMALEVEPARAMVWYAAYAHDAGLPDAPRAAAMAKAHLCDVYVRTTRAAIAAHGGIGYTWDYGLNYWFRRALFDAAWLGNSTQHRARAADMAGW